MGSLEEKAWLMLLPLRCLVGYFSIYSAYEIRLYAVSNFGRVIHEFDPWFNYRATEYLWQHGAAKFFKWFDYMSWYPLGRPIGTTIYPGMQFATVWIHQTLEFIGYPMNLNDVCVFVPAWFGVAATVFVGLLTSECTGSVDAGLAAAFIMAMIPAHIMRSVAGGYDNESVAIPLMCSTFYFWCRSLRSDSSWPIGVLTGISYFAMAATWGGYTFVLNMIGLHAVALVVAGRYTNKLHRAYSLFFFIGTALAIQVPVVGSAPLRSLEQMGPFGVFLILQGMFICKVVKLQRNLSEQDFVDFQRKFLLVTGAIASVAAGFLFQMGYFGPISARIRGLFVQHTRTGNPLVDSVAEHQATSPRAYWQYFNYMCYVAPLGFIISIHGLSDSKSFLLLYAAVAYYFSAKMNRLILLMGPIAASLGGIGTAGMFKWAIEEIRQPLVEFINGAEEEVEDKPPPASAPTPTKDSSDKKKWKGKSKAWQEATKAAEKSVKQSKRVPSEREEPDLLTEIFEPMMEMYEENILLRRVAAGFVLFVGSFYTMSFYTYCDRMGEALSQPSIMLKSRKSSGEIIIIDDYREAYWWLRDNTPEDARVMAWWDYGYQIAGVANRTTIADGNTWNHEHIATLGKCLTGPELKAYSVIRHLADYVLVWAGGGGDDLAKSPHMARIANSVYPDVCPGDPACRQFGFDREGNPTKMMTESTLFKLHSHNQRENVTANPDMYEEAYTSTHNLVRIFRVLNVSQESKEWAADPRNRQCDAPGSWYCQGQYPPAIKWLIETRKNFKQLEDFNAGTDAEAEAYQKAYHARLAEKKEHF